MAKFSLNDIDGGYDVPQAAQSAPQPAPTKTGNKFSLSDIEGGYTTPVASSTPAGIPQPTGSPAPVSTGSQGQPGGATESPSMLDKIRSFVKDTEILPVNKGAPTKEASPTGKYLGGLMDNFVGNVQKDIGMLATAKAKTREWAGIDGLLIKNEALKSFGNEAIKTGADQAAEAMKHLGAVSGFLSTPSGMMTAAGGGALALTARATALGVAAAEGVSLTAPKLAWETVKNLGRMTPSLLAMGATGAGADYALNKTVVQPAWPVHENEKGEPIINTPEDAENYAMNSMIRGLGGMVTGGITSLAAKGTKYLMNANSLANRLNRINLDAGDPLGKMADFAKSSQTVAKEFGSIHANSTANHEGLVHSDIMNLNTDTAKNIDKFMGELSTQSTPVTPEQVAKLKALGDHVKTLYTANEDGTFSNVPAKEMHDNIGAIINNYKEGNYGPGVIKEFADNIVNNNILGKTGSPLYEAQHAYSRGEAITPELEAKIKASFDSPEQGAAAMQWLKQNGTLQGISENIKAGKVIDPEHPLMEQLKGVVFPSVSAEADFHTLLNQHNASIYAKGLDDKYATQLATVNSDTPIDLSDVSKIALEVKANPTRIAGTDDYNPAFPAKYHSSIEGEHRAQGSAMGTSFEVAHEGMKDLKVTSEDEFVNMVDKTITAMRQVNTVVHDLNGAIAGFNPLQGQTAKGETQLRRTVEGMDPLTKGIIGDGIDLTALEGLDPHNRAIVENQLKAVEGLTKPSSFRPDNYFQLLKGLRDGLIHGAGANETGNLPNPTVVKFLNGAAKVLSNHINEMEEGAAVRALTHYTTMDADTAARIHQMSREDYGLKAGAQQNFQQGVGIKHSMDEGRVETKVNQTVKEILKDETSFHDWLNGQGLTQKATHGGQKISNEYKGVDSTNGEMYLDQLARSFPDNEGLQKKILSMKTGELQNYSLNNATLNHKILTVAAKEHPEYFEEGLSSKLGAPALDHIIEVAGKSNSFAAAVGANPRIAKLLYGDKGNLRTHAEVGQILVNAPGSANIGSNDEIREMLKRLQGYKGLEDVHSWAMDAAAGAYHTARIEINKAQGGNEEAVKKALEGWMSNDRPVTPSLAFKNPAADIPAFKIPVFFHGGKDMRTSSVAIKNDLEQQIGHIRKSDINTSPEQRAKDIITLAEAVKPVGIGKQYVPAIKQTSDQSEEAVQRMTTAAIDAQAAKTKLEWAKKFTKDTVFGNALGYAFGTHSMVENLALGLMMDKSGMTGKRKMAEKITESVRTAANLKRLGELSKQRTLNSAGVAGATMVGSELNRR